MAASRRQPDTPLKQALFEEAPWFDSFQAVRLLGRLARGHARNGRASVPADEVVRFKTRPTLAFLPAPVLALDAERNEIGDTVTVPQADEAAARLQMATGRTPIIYISRYGPDERGTGLPNSVLSRCPLWLPAYNSRPICPPGWSQWMLWQYTDGTIGSGAVPVAGIGRCDRSRFAGTVADLAAWWNGPAG